LDASVDVHAPVDVAGPHFRLFALNGGGVSADR
jgi:hypothetical protein